MPTLQFEHAIRDYAMWKAAFDRDPIDRRALGVRRHRLYRRVGDPNYIIGELEFDTVAEAQVCADALQQLWTSRQAAPALLGAPRVRIVETVEDVSYRGGPVIVGSADGDTIEGPLGGPLTFKVRGEQSGGRFTALENVIPPGAGPPLHTHLNEDEAWYVLDGELRFRLDDRIETATAGAFVFVPRGTPHCFRNPGERPARILLIFAPSGMERFFDQFASLSTPGPIAFAELGDPFGLKVVGPPLADADG